MSEQRSAPENAHVTQRELLQRYGLQPKRSFGQNFLLDASILGKLCDRIGEQSKGVLEIGAGLGALTRPLLERGLQVTAVERDRDLLPVLRQELAHYIDSQQLTLLEADAKTLDYAALLGALPAPRVLAGNLPYQLTGPLLRQTSKVAALMARAVFLVQLEVADRLVATPGSGDYGALSVFIQAGFAGQRAMVVRAGAFYPQPNVDSAVVVLTPHPIPIAEETPAFSEIVRRAFQQRRKTLKNSWSGLLGLSANQLQEAAARAKIDLSARGETLAVTDFARMAREVSSS